MKKPSKEKTLEEIYRESREREGPVKIPPQINHEYLLSLEKISNIEKFGELLKEFIKYQKLAKEKPGQMVQGNMILGAPSNEYYEPSEEEKRLSEIGIRIRNVSESLNDKNSMIKMINSMINNEIFLDQVVFKEFRFSHIDVVGSGRFIYPEVARDITFSIIAQLDKIVENKTSQNLLIEIKKIIDNPKAPIKKKKDLFKNLLNALK